MGHGCCPSWEEVPGKVGDRCLQMVFLQLELYLADARLNARGAATQMALRTAVPANRRYRLTRGRATGRRRWAVSQELGLSVTSAVLMVTWRCARTLARAPAEQKLKSMQ
eukprot:TRINITY_DN10702_c0_g1_i1.p3 TRINITY_DN10702_c0_g1~~TRINITY_DN10702_c0_g1_i1.p3  ORF type:complete len:110 (-),score=11.19 TRINITY_DN10702_c0_g1_i1:1148-1477(-)